MSSLSGKTKRKREMKRAKAGRLNKKARTKAGTPKFPIDPQKAAADEKSAAAS